MNLVRYNPRGMTPRIPFDRLFDDFFRAPGAEANTEASGVRTWSPAVDIEESEAAYDKGVLKITLPKAPEKQKKVRQISVK